MKVGILTYFGDMNSGTNLQALAVSRIAQAAHPSAEVRIIDYHPHERRWKPYLSGFSAKSLWLDIFRLRRYSRYVRSLPLTDRRLVSGDPVEATRFIDSFGFDVIYVGSDTLLELHRHKEDSLTAFWLSPAIRARKVFLAPSSREVEFEKLSPRRREEMARCLEAVDSISARDAATRRLMAHFVPESRISMLPDPTFALDIDQEPVERYVRSRGLDRLSKPMVCMHMHRRDAHCDAIAEDLRRQGYLVASLRPAPYADILLNDVGPREVLGIFKRFEFVVTHRFHDSIFCFKNGTPVLAYPPPDYKLNSAGESKFRSLFEMFGLEKTNLVSDFSEFSAERILGMKDGAIDSFRAAASNIQARLAANRDLLLSYAKDAGGSEPGEAK
ncbi:MAG: polysaccharide pyruvyl transferase family protein [Fibrobacterota bacterium]|nr:polysaccharide pyruvyl transferase family protein [Fibrobacterota bacterium]QQS03793.1 MAG: polysaccharide pyruvyl transferase family protein [Fibrobacterota bacterium]